MQGLDLFVRDHPRGARQGRLHVLHGEGNGCLRVTFSNAGVRVRLRRRDPGVQPPALAKASYRFRTPNSLSYSRCVTTAATSAMVPSSTRMLV